MATEVIEAQLEIDCNRGVIYVHSKRTGQTVLRICGLKKPLQDICHIDITLRSDKPAAVQYETLKGQEN